MTHRVEHHAVGHQPLVRSDRQFAAGLLRNGLDATEIRQDRREAHRQVGARDIRILLVESLGPNELVVGLRPLTPLGDDPGRDIGLRVAGLPHRARAVLRQEAFEAAGQREGVTKIDEDTLQQTGVRLSLDAQTGRRRREVGNDRLKKKLVGTLVIDDQIGCERRHLVLHDRRDIGRCDAFTAGVQHLEPKFEFLRRRPAIEPVAHVLGIRIEEVVRTHRRRSADEGDANRLRLARDRHRRATEAVFVGHETDRRRPVGQEAETRPGLAVGRVVDIDLARCVLEIEVPAGVWAHEGAVPCLEHVRTPGAFRHATGLDSPDQVDVLGLCRPPVRQWRRVLAEPGALNAFRQGNLTEVFQRIARRFGIEPAHQPFRGRRAEQDGQQDKQRVLQQDRHGSF